MLTKIRKYSTELSVKAVNDLLNKHSDPRYKFSFGNRYDVKVKNNEFLVKAMPASRRGIYREKLIGKIEKAASGANVEITSKLNKWGPVVVGGLFGLFFASVLPMVLDASERSSEENMKVVGMIGFMFIMCLIFYLVFIQLPSWMTKKWIEKKLKLIRLQK